MDRPDTVYVGRYHPVLATSKFGNPYKISDSMSRSDSVANFRKYFSSSALVADVMELQGKQLGCWCNVEQPCHTSVLLEYLDNA